MAESKYLTITEVTDPKSKKKTRDFIVTNRNSGDHLGWINWYPPFRKYAYTSADNIVYDTACLNDISAFISNLMAEHFQKSK